MALAQTANVKHFNPSPTRAFAACPSIPLKLLGFLAMSQPSF
jgi:hypothetical protein